MSKPVFATALVVLSVVSGVQAASPQESGKSAITSRDQSLDGIPLDGSIVIDESLWVSLLGEPGTHMTNAYRSFTDGKMAESAASVSKATTFLLIAGNNAFEKQNKALQAAAEQLADLGERIGAGKVTSENELKAVFGRSHLALSQHHLAKASFALKKQDWSLASNYLRSAAMHFQRASVWSGQELGPASVQGIADAKETADHLGPDHANSIETAGRLLELLREKLQQFSKSLKAIGLPGPPEQARSLED